MKLLHIVWSPRRIEQSLTAHESLGIPTAYIIGFNEHEGCAVANHVVRETDADLYVFSYDDHCPTRENLVEVLRLQRETGDVVSGWCLLGQDSNYGSATRPSWGTRQLAYCGAYDRHESGEAAACFYTKDELRESDSKLVPTNYFSTLTAIPREWLLEGPIWSMPAPVEGNALRIWPSPEGQPYDKGAGSDWTMAMDLLRNGHRLWTATRAEVLHLAPQHGVPHHKFWMAAEHDVRGVYWDRRPRSWEEFERARQLALPDSLPAKMLNDDQTGWCERELVLA